jgi:type VI secretion system secreted protein Hcp
MANIFTQISDIPGDATEEDHKEWIVLESMAWNLERAVDVTDSGSTQRGHANTDFGKCEVESQLGLASNKLMQSVANGTIRPEIIIHMTRSGESASSGLEAYSIWKLKDVVIDSYSVNYSASDVPTESWTMSCASVEHEYKSTNQKTGKLSTENTFLWNIQTGRAE